jgi:hypothetical protein
MRCSYRSVEAGEEMQPSGGDAGKNHPAIFGFAATSDQAALFEAVEEAGDIRVVSDHPGGDFAAREAFAGTAQDAQDVVLMRGDARGLEDANGAAGEHLGGPENVEEDGLLTAGSEAFPFPPKAWRGSHTINNSRYND